MRGATPSTDLKAALLYLLPAGVPRTARRSVSKYRRYTER
jgi:hypothetical protein